MAPRRGRIVKVDNILDYENLTVKEVLCPICRSILIEPVTLPCNHVFCSSCFASTMENSNLVCPLCRVRIGSWLRSSKKGNNLINVKYWNAIKRLFPEQIKNKLDGVEENFDYDAPLIRLSNPGELRAEYEKEAEKMRKELEIEDKASEELARKLCEEEERLKIEEEEKLKLDEEIAKNLALALGMEKNLKRGPLDKYFTLKGSSSDLSKCSVDKEYSNRILCLDSGKKQIKSNEVSAALADVRDSNFYSVDSSDSIDSEFRYFKPIDYKKNLPCEKWSPVKVPAVTIGPRNSAIRAPKGSARLILSTGLSAFAPYTFSKKLKGDPCDSRQKSPRRKSRSPEKKQNQIQSQLKEKYGKHSTFKRKLLSPSSPFRGFGDEKEMLFFKRSRKSNIEHQKNRESQEKSDFELAKKLQEHYNAVDYQNRRSFMKRAPKENSSLLSTTGWSAFASYTFSKSSDREPCDSQRKLQRRKSQSLEKTQNQIGSHHEIYRKHPTFERKLLSPGSPFRGFGDEK